ncbi:unnamed protein product, partial [Choristocarpus tenellus]
LCRGLNLQGKTRYTREPSNKVVVTWMARRSSVQWPERKYCSENGAADGTYFVCDYFRHLGTRELQRKVKNDKAVVQGLKDLEQASFPNGAQVEVRDMDYNLISFEEQILNDLETDIMIGPHGAGLYHIVFTPDRAVLIELQVDGTNGRKHFNNLARWSGRGYKGGSQMNPVPVERAKQLVSEAVQAMDLGRH